MFQTKLAYYEFGCIWKVYTIMTEVGQHICFDLLMDSYLLKMDINFILYSKVLQGPTTNIQVVL